MLILVFAIGNQVLVNIDIHSNGWRESVKRFSQTESIVVEQVNKGKEEKIARQSLL